ncbi:hypothetical protein HYG89_11800 [Acinetobacter sp. SwsAc5]|uniref:hypothetical protein n=1 Tax=Acinetobacter sp. SwsAc5 TaxID=2749438 RepID=UPI0015C0AE8C|nr:hypothetical protein [Acinetobacter sp. SwsAc5]NWK53216.1 hypothetical protein [Acinetobacter sp. SwsAc5]
MSGQRNKKEYKIVIQKEKDPDLYKWALSLNYGLFPKLIVEMLRWYEKNNLLVKGGVASPDLLLKQNLNTPNFSNSDFEKQVIQKLNQLELLISSKNIGVIGTGVEHTNDFEQLSNGQVEIKANKHEFSTTSNLDLVNETSNSGSGVEAEEGDAIPVPLPSTGDFRVFKYKGKGK